MNKILRYIDTGRFHIKRESFVTVEVMWIIQESKSISFI